MSYPPWKHALLDTLPVQSARQLRQRGQFRSTEGFRVIYRKNRQVGLGSVRFMDWTARQSSSRASSAALASVTISLGFATLRASIMVTWIGPYCVYFFYLFTFVHHAASQPEPGFNLILCNVGALEAASRHPLVILISSSTILFDRSQVKK